MIGEKQRAVLVEQIKAHVLRYKQVGQLETGLSQFITSAQPAKGEAAKALTIQWSGTLDQLPAGRGARGADRASSSIGSPSWATQAFQEAAATLAADANQTLHRHDRAALTLVSELMRLYPGSGSPISDAVVARYVAAERWSAAAEAMATYYAHRDDKGRWELLRLKVQQAQRVEDRLLAANRQLDKELPALIKEALAEAVAILAAQPDKPTRQATLAVVQPLVDRYLQHERPDLAEAVIKATADVPAGAPLADWALWVRANLLQREAARTLALQAAQSEGKPPAALVDAHKAELPLLHKLIAEHPQSEHYQAAVDRFAQISTLYLNQRSYDVARGVLADFLKAHGKLNVAVRIEYELAKISLHQAGIAFNERKEKVKPPQQLLAEHKAAIEAIAAFLKAHPTGDYSAAGGRGPVGHRPRVRPGRRVAGGPRGAHAVCGRGSRLSQSRAVEALPGGQLPGRARSGPRFEPAESRAQAGASPGAKERSRPWPPISAATTASTSAGRKAKT